MGKGLRWKRRKPLLFNAPMASSTAPTPPVSSPDSAPSTATSSACGNPSGGTHGSSAFHRVPAKWAFVYVIGTTPHASGSTTRRTYVGWTVDLEQRLARHNTSTGAKATRGHQWELLYAERYATRSEAMRREWFLKRDRRLRKAIADFG